MIQIVPAPCAFPVHTIINICFATNDQRREILKEKAAFTKSPLDLFWGD